MHPLTPEYIATLQSRAAARAHQYQPPRIDSLQDFRPHPDASTRPTSLWHPYIPRSGITLLAAPPGAGKSSLTLDLAARISNGHPMPDGTTSAQTPGRVLIIAPEDPQHLVAQRLHLLHADPQRIHFRPQLPGDELETLTELVEELPPDLALIIIDPVTSFLQHLSPGTLWHYAYAAEDHNVPVLLTVPVPRPIYSPADLPRTLGALSSYPRSILSLVPGPTTQSSVPSTQHSRLVLPIKINGAALPPPVPFTLGPTLTWHPTTPNQPAPLEPALQEAVNFLQDFLNQGPQPAAHIRKRASENLISPYYLKRAKDHLQIVSKHADYQAPYYWYPPDPAPQAAPENLAKP